MKNIQGKLVILFIFGVALAAGALAVSFKMLRDRRVIELWGPQAASLINIQADEIHLLVLDEPAAAPAKNIPAESITIDNQQRRIVRQVDITDARGMINARHSLIDDPSFAWEKQRGDCPPQWKYGLQFSHDNETATLLIDVNCQRARLLETGAEASIAPIFKALTGFMAENLKES